jgi:hypothetical protein
VLAVTATATAGRTNRRVFQMHPNLNFNALKEYIEAEGLQISVDA